MAEQRAPAASGASVVLDVDYNRGSFELVIANIGTDVAHEVRVEFSRTLVGARDTEVSALPVFRRLRTIRPGKEVRIFLDGALDLFRRRKTNTFTAIVRWQDTAGREAKAAFRHDLDAYRGMPEIMVRDPR